jgi:hypothetical protein
MFYGIFGLVMNLYLVCTFDSWTVYTLNTEHDGLVELQIDSKAFAAYLFLGILSKLLTIYLGSLMIKIVKPTIY